MLGLGRALGETMAVTFVIGNANRITTSLFGPGNTIASLVALEFARERDRQPEARLAAGARLHPVRHLLHRARLLFHLKARLGQVEILRLYLILYLQ